MASNSSLLKEFREFIMRGNVLDLAVAVIVGTAFNVVVKSLVDNVIMPIIAAIGGKQDFSDLVATINNSPIRYGSFITDVVNFLIIAASVFLIVRVFQTLQDRRRTGEIAPEDGPAPTDEALLLGEIRDLLAAQANHPNTPPPTTPVGL
jgi:large conductance mechanosensitive channel